MLITFDLDGVLMQNPFIDGVFPEVKERLYQQYLRRYDKDKLENNEKKIKELIWKEILKEYRKLFSNNSYQAYDWDLIVQTAAEKLNLSGGMDIAELVKKYCHKPYIKRYEDVVESLKWLYRRDYSLKVVTNGYFRYQYPVMEKLNIADYFSEIVSCDKAESAKPDEAIFLAAVNNDKSWFHVGDSVLMDVYGTKKLDGTAIFLDRNLPDDIKALELQKRAYNEITRNYIEAKVEEEFELNRVEYNKEEIYPDYVITTLGELIKILDV